MSMTIPGLGRRIRPEESVTALLDQTDEPARQPTELGARTRGHEADNSPGKMPAFASFEPRAPRATFHDLVLPAVTRTQIDTLLARIRHHDLLYREWELSRIDPSGRNKAVNLYGPPGTGKTMCAEALADELGQQVIEVNYAEIESKYVGETPKNIRTAFASARDHDAVLFFDEADSILGRRMTRVTQAADQAVNVSRAVMLKQLDAFDGVVVFATNLARNFDPAFVRRILLHIEVPPPDTAGRTELWQRMLSPRVPGRDALEWPRLTEASDGLVGGDIKNAVVLCLAELAQRDEATRRLHTQDLLRAIEQVGRAKQDVGSGHEFTFP